MTGEFSFTVDLTTLLLSLAACVLASVVLASLYCIFLLSRFKSEFFARMKKLESNMNVINSSTLGMGQKILAIEKNIHALKIAQDERKVTEFDVSYSTAEKLISQGADDRAIAANVSLSASEINLMRLLHGNEGKTARHSEASIQFEPLNASEALLAQKIRDYQQQMAVSG